MHKLPKLPYKYDALEPHIDVETMKVHHGKHHRAYTDKLNEVLAKYPNLQKQSPSDLLRNLVSLPVDDADRALLRNHGGGYLNHALFWDVLGPEKAIDEKLVADVEQTYGSVETFRDRFTTQSTRHFGSGWTWLVRDGDGKLDLYTLPNQDSPYTLGHTPILMLDLWEHAYYLKYQNRRADYLKAFWNVVDWDAVERRYRDARR